MGKIPAWYAVIRAARYLKVAPWELTVQPIFWYHRAVAAEAAEAYAAQQHQKSQLKGLRRG